MSKLSVLSRVASIALFVGAGAGAGAQAQGLTGQEVMDKYFHISKPKTVVMNISMVISKGGKTLSRTMTAWSIGDNAKGEVERKVIKFLAPGDIKGSGFLTEKKVDGSTESQLWLPALGKVRRLSSGPSDQDQAFFGSDFTNRDIGGFIESDFSYELKAFTDNLYTVAAKPKQAIGYDLLVYTINAKDFHNTKIEYYKNGQLAKSQTIVYVPIGQYEMPSDIVMTAASGSSTEMKLSDYKVDQAFGGQIFTERFLKQ
jgi:Outer membrane lipoprotein-sorting protein